MAKIRRIVCYAVNGSGMGHITRLLSVARWMRRYASLIEGQAPEILFLTSSEATGVLLQAGFASFKLPSKTVVRQAGMDMIEYRRLARHFVWQTLATFHPDLLVVDTFPAGSFDELLQILDGPFHRALIMRRVKPEYAARAIFQASLRLYPTLVIPHAPGLPAQVYGVPSSKQAHFSGEVLQFELDELLLPTQVRDMLGIAPGRKLVYVSAGGGGDAGSQEALHSLIDSLRQRDDLHLLVGAGPLYKGKRAGGAHLTWFTEPGIWRFFGACEAAFSAGGYNTFHELLLSRTPTAFYAQPKIADHQAGRIEDAAQAGACLFLRDPHNSEEILSCLQTLLSDSFRESCKEAMELVLPDNGAARCAQHLLSGAYSQASLSWAAQLASPAVALAFEAHGAPGRKMMARWLPTLAPQGVLTNLESQPAFEALTAQLSPSARTELQTLLTAQPNHQHAHRLQETLLLWLDTANTWPGGVERITSLLDLALKKHPLAQEEGNLWLPWLTGVLSSLHDTFARVSLLQAAQVAQVYRVFPRVVDVGHVEAHRIFVRFVMAQHKQGKTVAQMEQTLRAFKFAHRRVTRALCQEAWPQGVL